MKSFNNNEDFESWVKEASIDHLLQALIELYDGWCSAQEDSSLYEEEGEMLSLQYKMIEIEIKRRASH